MHLSLDLEMYLGELGTRTVTFGVEFHPPTFEESGELAIESATTQGVQFYPILRLLTSSDWTALKHDLLEKACAQEGF